jgi:thioredoxin 1
VLTLILCLLIGGGIGAAARCFGRSSSSSGSSSGAWRRGAVLGAILGAALYYLAGDDGGTVMDRSTANVRRISQDQFEAEVVRAAKPVVVEVYAVWCGPCRRLSPVLEKLAGSLTNRAEFVKLNLDEVPALASRFDIQGVPTLLFFNKGKLVSTILGGPEEDDLKKRLESFVEKSGS